MRNLRKGVTLKKVDSSALERMCEFELTPYEVLMEDISSRRYELKKVMVSADGYGSKENVDELKYVVRMLLGVEH